MEFPWRRIDPFPPLPLCGQPHDVDEDEDDEEEGVEGVWVHIWRWMDLPSLPVAHLLTLPDWWKHLFHLFPSSHLIFTIFPPTTFHQHRECLEIDDPKIPTCKVPVKARAHTRVPHSYAIAIKYARWQIQARGREGGDIGGWFLACHLFITFCSNARIVFRWKHIEMHCKSSCNRH